MKTILKTNQKGFTLIETLVAVLILAICVDAVMSLAAGGFFSVKYAKNQIVATALAQESLEYIRNTRDTMYQQGKTWDDWRKVYNVGTGGTINNNLAGNWGCWSADGCAVSPYSSIPVVQCGSSSCPPIYYYPKAFDSTSGFYGYKPATPLAQYPQGISSVDSYVTTYGRVVKMEVSPNDPGEVMVTVVVSWLDGNTKRSTTQSMLITDWRP